MYDMDVLVVEQEVSLEEHELLGEMTGALVKVWPEET